MKTMKSLKATFAGMGIMGTVMTLVLILMDTLQYSTIDWSYVANTAVTVLAFELGSMVVAYIGWHLKNAVVSDIVDFKEWKKERRSNKVERA